MARPKSIVTPESKAEDAVFGATTVQETNKNPEMIQVSQADFKSMMDRLNALEGKESAIDLGDIKKRKRIIRVPFWTNYETGKDYIVTGLEPRTERDGAVIQTWTRGMEENNQGNRVPITWCKPILVDLESKEQSVEEIRYDEFASNVRVIAIEVDSVDTEQVDLTPKASENETVEQVNYVEVGSMVRPQGTNVKVKVKVWGVKNTFYITYEGQKYTIDDSVVNFK